MEKIIIIDDLCPGQEVRAEVTRYIGLDGEWRKLDLTGKHDRELHDALERYWSAARKAEPPQRRRHADPETGKPDLRASRRYWDEFRAWCDERGIKYRTKTGKFYAPRKAVGEYERYLAERAGEQGDQAAG